MAVLEHIDRMDHRMCRAFNQTLRWRLIHPFFTLISKAGDGPVWYALIVSLPIYAALTGHSHAHRAALVLTVAGLVGLTLYRNLKTRLARERPFITYSDIDCTHQPLDRYSFPSGHTLHAVMFTTIAVAWLPALSVVLIPLTGLIALSRLVLGLHYPTDVIVGALIGFSLAQCALLISPPMH